MNKLDNDKPKTKVERLKYSVEVEQRHYNFLLENGFAGTPSGKVAASLDRLDQRKKHLQKAKAEEGV